MKMGKKAIYGGLLAMAVTASGWGLAQAAENEHADQALHKEATISMAQAQNIALHTVKGRIIKAELEREHGGSGLRYSFDVKAGKQVHEVGVDARNGKVLENSIDNGND